MQSLLLQARHVLATQESGISILSFTKTNEMIGRFPYATRQEAIHALEELTGKGVLLSPMQTPGAELVLMPPELPEDIAVEAQ